MKLKVDLEQFTYRGKGSFDLADYPHRLKAAPYEDKKDYRSRLEDFAEEIHELQSMMYAHDRYAMLLVFQAMDAAGKDGTIGKVMSGINPHGIKVQSFKKPTDEELDHGFLWRTNKAMPERGRITIFNRSYYEEVLVAKVHPGIVTDAQRLPVEQTKDMKALWKSRYRAIRNLEAYLHDNGTRVVKFFLNVSRDEQRKRFLDRIDEPEKNWKFSEADVEERKYWDDYMAAYQDAIDATSTPECPWYVVPADDKRAMRLIVAKIVLSRLEELDLHYPQVSDERRAELAAYRERLVGD